MNLIDESSMISSEISFLYIVSLQHPVPSGLLSSFKLNAGERTLRLSENELPDCCVVNKLQLEKFNFHCLW